VDRNGSPDDANADFRHPAEEISSWRPGSVRWRLVTPHLNLSNILAYPPAEFAGVIVLRLASQAHLTVAAAIQRMLELASAEPLLEPFWIVEERHTLFPQLRASNGIIESPLHPADRMREAQHTHRGPASPESIRGSMPANPPTMTKSMSASLRPRPLLVSDPGPIH
jgi:hypothetical protein